MKFLYKYKHYHQNYKNNIINLKFDKLIFKYALYKKCKFIVKEYVLL